MSRKPKTSTAKVDAKVWLEFHAIVDKASPQFRAKRPTEYSVSWRVQAADKSVLIVREAVCTDATVAIETYETWARALGVTP